MTASDCVFCRIISGQIPASMVLQDDACAAFMDVSPLAEGHVLLVPATHAAQLDELTADQAQAMLRHLPALVAGVRRATGCQAVNILQNNGALAGQAVMHVHFHVIPRRAGDAFHFNWPAGKYPPGRAEELADQIRQAMAR